MADRIEIVVTHPGAEREAQEAMAKAKLFGLGIVGLILYWIYDTIVHWANHPAPYKYVLAFYYYTIIAPVHSFGWVWNWLKSIHFLPFEGINLIISGIGIVIYTVIFLGIIASTLHYVIKKIGKEETIVMTVLFFILPIILLVLWLVVSGIFSWLFATH